MELISRKAVLDGIDKYIEKAQSTGTKDDFISFAELGVKALPSAFEGMTNGEVVKSVFPMAEIIKTTYNGFHVVEVWFGGFLVRFRSEWWNAPYKEVRE